MTVQYYGTFICTILQGLSSKVDVDSVIGRYKEVRLSIDKPRNILIYYIYLIWILEITWF